jgi:hypothetical protein
MNFGMKRAIDIDSDGYTLVPEAPGIGIAWGLDFIENCRIKAL